jgi:ribonucleases P/MRP protein subunit RPP40
MGRFLFSLFASDMGENVSSPLLQFADDTKVYNLSSHQRTIQKDLDCLSLWCDKWSLAMNAEKCHAMHLGYHNPLHQYTINQTIVQPVTTEKDLGVTVSNTLKWGDHCKTVSGKASRMLAMIRRSFGQLQSKEFLVLYKTYVRPQMEFCSTVWWPHYSKDINLLEKVQRRATKYVVGLSHLPYEERLKSLDLPSLAYRYLRGSLIETFKLLNGYYKVNYKNFFTLYRDAETVRQLRGHKMKIKKKPQLFH